MSAIDEFEAYVKRFGQAVGQALINDVADCVKTEMALQIEKHVYDAYDPVKYERRYEHGGLTDPANMEASLSDEFTLHVVNTTGDTGHMGHWSNGVSRTKNIYGATDGEGTVSKAVELGIGYTWERSAIFGKQPYPRPFHKPTEDAVTKTPALAKLALLNGLKRQGY